MTDSKKTRERYFLDEFIAVYPEFPVGKIVGYESPDFLIEQGAKVIGIEIVDYIRGQNKGESVERRKEILWQKVADEARRKFEAKFSEPLLVHFFWNNRYVLRQSEIPQLADGAVEIIKNYVPVQLFENICIGSDEIENTVIEKACHSISVTRVRNEKQSLWSFISVGFTEVQENEIQHLLDLKNNKVHEYLQNCDVVLLIIVADGNHISSNIDITSDALNNIYNTSFERVFVYDQISKTVFPLTLR